MQKTNSIRKQQRAKRIKWLLEHQQLWEGYPYQDPLGRIEYRDPRDKEIVEAMKAEGLISKRTYWPDVNLFSLIAEARRLRRDRIIKGSVND